MHSPDCPDYLLVTNQWRNTCLKHKFMAGKGRKCTMIGLYGTDGNLYYSGNIHDVSMQAGCAIQTIYNSCRLGCLIGGQYHAKFLEKEVANGQD